MSHYFLQNPLRINGCMWTRDFIDSWGEIHTKKQQTGTDKESEEAMDISKYLLTHQLRQCLSTISWIRIFFPLFTLQIYVTQLQLYITWLRSKGERQNTSSFTHLQPLLPRKVQKKSAPTGVWRDASVILKGAKYSRYFHISKQNSFRNHNFFSF